MDGVPTRTPTGRPRAAAVGAILALCLVGAPLMSLFPVALWEAAQRITLGGLGQGALLVAPVAVGGMVLMIVLARVWLKAAGVARPTACACLATVTTMATPMVMGFLAPAFTPLPGGARVNGMVVSALVATAALCLCALLSRHVGRIQPGILSGVAVVAAALLVLPFASEHMRVLSTDQRSLAQINEFGHTIAVLDHPAWAPTRVHEVHGGLRLTYTASDDQERQDDQGGQGGQEGQDGREGPGATGMFGPAPVTAAGPGVGADDPDQTWTGALHVLSWTPDRMAAGIRSGCDFPRVECTESDSLVVVHRGVGTQEGAHLSEVRAHLEDGTIASVHPVGALSPELPLAVAEALRAEEPGERDSLIQAVVEN